MISVVIASDLGSDFDIGNIEPEKLNILRASTSTFGLMRFATVNQIQNGIPGLAVDSGDFANAVKQAAAVTLGDVAVEGGGLATGGGKLNENQTITVTAATADDAIGGTREDVVLTPATMAAVLAAAPAIDLANGANLPFGAVVGLGAAAALNVGVGAGTVAAGNDSRIVNAVQSSSLGAANGVATLDGTGKVPSAQLPSYVDDVLEYSTYSALPTPGEAGKIYVTIDTNYEYRWSGSTYIQLVKSPGSTDAVPEGTANLYFTPARALAAVPPSSAVPTMAGSASVGTVMSWARGDHVHPSDTSRLAIASLGTNVLAALGNALNASSGLLSVSQATSTYASQVAANLRDGATLAGGLLLVDGTPVVTTNTLYNIGGVLYWNGSPVANGASVNGTPGCVPVFTGANSLGNSLLVQVGATIYNGNAGGASALVVGNNAGGKTQLQLATSSDGGGYGIVQGVSSAGSSWGNVALNPNGGSVGVNTNSPNAPFHVNGLSLLGGSATNSTALSVYSGGSGFVSIEGVDPTNGGTKRNIALAAYGGNVGIGTSSPGRALHVVGPSSGAIPGFAVNNAGYGLLFGGDDGNAANAVLQATQAGVTNNILLKINPYGGNVSFNNVLASRQWLTGFVTPELFGAVGDGSADDTSAIQAAFNDGRPVYLPNVYKIMSTVSRTVTYPLLVFGRGRGSGIHAHHASGDALHFDLGTPGSPFGANGMVTCRDFEIVSHVANANAGLTINTGASSGSSEPQFFAENVHILPSDASGNTGFSAGMYLGNARNMTLVGCVIAGRYFAYNGSGIFWNAYSTSSAPVDLHVIDCQIL
jgi:hypothetical protein